MVFRVPGSPRQVRKALANPAWPDDPMSGQAVESQGGSRSREFADAGSRGRQNDRGRSRGASSLSVTVTLHNPLLTLLRLC